MPEQPEIELIREVLADHIWHPKKRGPAECWSANDHECDERFTTGGDYRRHVASLIAARLAERPQRIPYVTTIDGRNWSAEAVELLVKERDAIRSQRDGAQLMRDRLLGAVRRLRRAVDE